MEYRSLGKSGLKISALSLGAWVTFHHQLDEELAQACMQKAYAAGVNFFDNAETYANGQAEIIMGKVIHRLGWKRSDIVVSTKLFWGGSGPNDTGLSRKHIIEGTDAALERLHMNYVDLIFCHRPDPETPMEETVRAMSHVINQGKAFYWGTSEWSSEQIRHAHAIARRERLIPPTMEQPQYNLFHRHRVEREYLPLYADMGLGLTTWSPLASGILTGKYQDGIPANSRLALPGYEWLRSHVESPEGQRRVAKTRQLTIIAQELGCSTAQLGLAWCLKNPWVSSVITGASQPEQVVENMQALALVTKLSPELMERIEQILANHPGREPNFRS